MPESKEPEHLRKAKRFHKLIQNEWLETAKNGIPRPERYIKKVNGKRGRVDILVEELNDAFISVIEIKSTGWDKILERNVLRNIKRHARQIWKYINSQLFLSGKEVCPGIIYPKRPKNLALLELIEEEFNKEGVQVVWHDETPKQLKQRILKKK